MLHRHNPLSAPAAVFLPTSNPLNAQSQTIRFVHDCYDRPFVEPALLYRFVPDSVINAQRLLQSLADNMFKFK